MATDLNVTIEINQDDIDKYERFFLSLVLRYRILCRHASRSPMYDRYVRYLKENYGIKPIL